MSMEFEAAFEGFMDYVLECFPSAEVSEDEDGQLIINTGLHQDSTGQIVPLPDIGSDADFEPYPNGQCVGCGFGLSESWACTNDECPLSVLYEEEDV